MEVFEISLYFDKKVYRDAQSSCGYNEISDLPKNPAASSASFYSSLCYSSQTHPHLCYGSKLGTEQSAFQETTSYVLRKLRTHPQLWLFFNRIPWKLVLVLCEFCDSYLKTSYLSWGKILMIQSGSLELGRSLLRGQLVLREQLVICLWEPVEVAGGGN